MLVEYIFILWKMNKNLFYEFVNQFRIKQCFKIIFPSSTTKKMNTRFEINPFFPLYSLFYSALFHFVLSCCLLSGWLWVVMFSAVSWPSCCLTLTLRESWLTDWPITLQTFLFFPRTNDRSISHSLNLSPPERLLQCQDWHVKCVRAREERKNNIHQLTVMW